MDQLVRRNLLAIVAAYRKATGKSLTQISKEFYGSSDFFEQYRRGTHTISVKRLDSMVQQFRDCWPPDAAWPLTRPIMMTQRVIR